MRVVMMVAMAVCAAITAAAVFMSRDAARRAAELRVELDDCILANGDLLRMLAEQQAAIEALRREQDEARARAEKAIIERDQALRRIRQWQASRPAVGRTQCDDTPVPVEVARWLRGS